MKKITWFLVALVFAVSGMSLIHRFQTQQFTNEIGRMNALWERQSIARDLTLDLETYRRTNSQFRKMNDAQVAAIKAKLSKKVISSVGRLAELEPTAEEGALGKKLNQQINEFMDLSAKLEPMLFLRDPYLKEEAVAAHDEMLGTIQSLHDGSEKRLREVQAKVGTQNARMDQALYALGVVVLALFGATVLSFSLSYVRPSKKLLARIREIQAGKLKRENPTGLTGVHREIETCLDELAARAESQQRERHQFVTAVATDLRLPIVPLQTSAAMLGTVASQLSPAQREEASEVVRRSVQRLSRTLDDLTDTLQAESGQIRLEEKVVDLCECLNGVASFFNGPGSIHDIRVFKPSIPVWALVDGNRIERVLINLVTKMMQYSPQGGRIDLALTQSGKRNGALEITVHQGARDGASESMRVTGPEQDVLRHWISENGFGLALSQKVMASHGGSLTAAGLAGTSVVFTVRVPDERIAGATAMGATRVGHGQGMMMSQPPGMA